MVSVVRQRGVAYLWMLFLVFLLGLGLGKSLEVYSTSVQREREADFLYVGGLYRNAIKQFYLGSPGSLRKYPASLEDLLKDPRFPVPRRYLRQLYPDPLTGKEFVAIPAPEGGIWGVRSMSTKRPWRVLGVGETNIVPVVNGGGTYQDWQFVYQGTGN